MSVNTCTYMCILTQNYNINTILEYKKCKKSSKSENISFHTKLLLLLLLCYYYSSYCCCCYYYYYHYYYYYYLVSLFFYNQQNFLEVGIGPINRTFEDSWRFLQARCPSCHPSNIKTVTDRHLSNSLFSRTTCASQHQKG